MKKILIIFAALFSCTPLQAKIVFAEKWVDPTGEKPPVVLWADVHEETEEEIEVSAMQAEELVQLTADKGLTFLLEIGPDHQEVDGFKGTMQFFINNLRTSSEQTLGVDIRHDLAITVQKLTTILDPKADDEAVAEPNLDSEITIQEAMNAPIAAVAKHKMPIFNRKNVITEFSKGFKDVQVKTVMTMPRGAYLPMLAKKPRELSEFEAQRALMLLVVLGGRIKPLMDAITLGYIEKSTQPVLAYFGASHISNIIKKLPELGYQRVLDVGEESRELWHEFAEQESNPSKGLIERVMNLPALAPQELTPLFEGDDT